jgi:putative transposase
MKGQHASFWADNGTDQDPPDAVEVNGKRIKLPVIGWVKMREVLRLDDKVGSAVVSGTADRWFASLRVRWSPILPIRENRNGANSTERRGQSS